MKKKKKFFLLFLLFAAFLLLIYIGNYFYLIRSPEGYYKKVFFPQLYLEIEGSNTHPNFVFHYQDFGAFGARLFNFIKNKNGIFRLNREIPVIVYKDSIYFNTNDPLGHTSEVKNGNWLHIYKKNGEKYFQSLENFSYQNTDTLQIGYLFKFSNSKFIKMKTLKKNFINAEKLDTGYYFLTYPGFFMIR